MADISIQFHALPKEIMPVFRSFVENAGAHVVSINFHPFQAVEVAPSTLGAVFEDPSVRRLAVTLQSPILPVRGMNEFLDNNPGALLLEVGRRSAEGLNESWLTARAEDAGTLTEWRNFAKLLRAMTRAGAVAVNPETGETGELKNHRFSPGAQALEREGVPMLPAAGTSRLRFKG